MDYFYAADNSHSSSLSAHRGSSRVRWLPVPFLLSFRRAAEKTRFARPAVSPLFHTPLALRHASRPLHACASLYTPPYALRRAMLLPLRRAACRPSDALTPATHLAVPQLLVMSPAATSFRSAGARRDGARALPLPVRHQNLEPAPNFLLRVPHVVPANVRAHCAGCVLPHLPPLFSDALAERLSSFPGICRATAAR